MGDLADSFKNLLSMPAASIVRPPTVNMPALPPQQVLNPAKTAPTLDPLQGQVTSTLAALSMSVDKHIFEQKQGNKDWPEFYVQCIDGNASIKVWIS